MKAHHLVTLESSSLTVLQCVIKCRAKTCGAERNKTCPKSLDLSLLLSHPPLPHISALSLFPHTTFTVQTVRKDLPCKTILLSIGSLEFGNMREL